MTAYRTKGQILEVWSKARPHERDQILAFIHANSIRGFRFKFYLCHLFNLDTQADMCSAGCSLDDGSEGLYVEEIIPLLTGKPYMKKPPTPVTVPPQKPNRQPVSFPLPTQATNQLTLDLDAVRGQQPIFQKLHTKARKAAENPGMKKPRVFKIAGQEWKARE